MIYNGFVVVDTRDSTGTETGYCGGEPSYVGEPGGDRTPLPGLGGGGYTPPPAPGYTPPPSTGGKNWQQYFNPQTLGAAAGVLGSIVGTVQANKLNNPDATRIKAVCGRKPLFNIGGKKDRYFQCVQNLLIPQPVYTPPSSGMSTSTKVIIGFVVAIVLIMIVMMVIMMNKNKAGAVKA